jgi:hypothetical protein
LGGSTTVTTAALSADWLPHDAAAHELGTGKTRVEMLVSVGRRIAMVPKFIRADGISATRLELRRMWFNADTTAHGIEALRQYRTAYDEKTKTFSDTPQRDWTTDIARAARYMAIAAREIAPPPPHASERPPGISMSDMTMDEFMDIGGRASARSQGLGSGAMRDRVWDRLSRPVININQNN